MIVRYAAVNTIKVGRREKGQAKEFLPHRNMSDLSVIAVATFTIIPFSL
jgi:hypothetical protein